jgi:hypothetical protein
MNADAFDTLLGLKLPTVIGAVERRDGATARRSAR